MYIIEKKQTNTWFRLGLQFSSDKNKIIESPDFNNNINDLLDEYFLEKKEDESLRDEIMKSEETTILTDQLSNLVWRS